MLLGFFVISIGFVVLYRWVPVPLTPLMLIRCAEQKAQDKPLRIDKQWRAIEHISPHLQLAVVCCEDQHFLEHRGFDVEAIKKALKHNEKSQRKRGASTISQQVAKNVFLWNGRTWIRKGFETYFTFLIETLWSKERIMEVYLNVIELGDGIYGAEAASQHYFDKPASQLSRRQAASLAVLLPNPLHYTITTESAYIQRRINWTLQQMTFWGGELNYQASKQ